MAVTIAQIAARSDLSARAVSYALTGRPGVSEATRLRVRKLAEEMGYRPSAAARAMRSNRTGHVGVLLKNHPGDRTTHPMVFETVLGLNEGIRGGGSLLTMVRIGDVAEGLRKENRVFSERVLDALVVFCDLPDRLDRKVQKLIPRVIWVESQTWGDQFCLRRDEFAAGRACGERVLGLGYRDLVWVCRQEKPRRRDGYTEVDRDRGFRAAVKGSGARVRRFKLAYDDPADVEAAGELLGGLTPGTAVVVSQAYQARWLAHAAGSLGLTAPRDFGLCCCDDSDDVGNVWPGLSRVSFDRYAMGQRAGAMLLRLLEDADADCPSEVLGGHWIAGDTVRRRDAARP